jgi:hypothetical protein
MTYVKVFSNKLYKGINWVFFCIFLYIACFDENLSREIPFHCREHKTLALELPLLANGLPAHCDNK